MTSSLYLDDNGVLTLTQQTGPTSTKVQQFNVSDISHVDYRRPGFLSQGMLRFHLKDGTKTEVVNVAKPHRALFDQLVVAVQKNIDERDSINPFATEPQSRHKAPRVAQSLVTDLPHTPTDNRSPDKHQALGTNEFVAVDVEWTDSTDHGTVCEIGLAKFVNGALAGSYREYVRPQNRFEMGEHEFRTHGIGRHLVDNAQTLAEQWPGIQEFIGGRTLVLHKATNDVNNVLSSIGGRAGELVADFIYLDTMLIAKKLPWITVKNGLSDLAKHFGIERIWANYDGREHVDDPHGAVEDAIATGQILLKMMEMAGYKTLLGFTELVGTSPGVVRGAEVVQGASAPGKIAWPHLDQLPDEKTLLEQKQKYEARYQKSQDKRAVAEQAKQDFLDQDPIRWSNLRIQTGDEVYFSSFPVDVEDRIWKVAQELGVNRLRFNAGITLLVIEDSAARGSGRLRDALAYRNPIAVTNYSNFAENNPEFPAKDW